MEIPNIYFPNLGLSFHLNSEAFSIFGVPVYWYGIILTSGIILGTFLACYIAKKEKLDPNVFMDFVLYDIVFALLGTINTTKKGLSSYFCKCDKDRIVLENEPDLDQLNLTAKALHAKTDLSLTNWNASWHPVITVDLSP